MKNILRIFKQDVQRFSKNVIALIVVLGMIVVPALYAWFNIAASWDPYGNTKNLKVAVASADEGYTGELVPVDLNLGDNVLSALRENTQLDWTFTSEKKAVSGVKSGKYYAAIVIPKDFSKNLMSLFSSQVVNPELIYYSNAKENAIAPKVTDKGASALQTQIKEVFITTISNTALSAMQAVSDTADKQGAQSIAATLIANLEKTSSELTAAANTVEAFSNMAKATQQMLDSSSDFLKQSRQNTGSSMDTLNQTQTSFSDMQGAITGTTDGINQALSDGQEFYGELEQIIRENLDGVTLDTSLAADSLETLAGKTTEIITSYEGMRDAMTELENQNPDLAPVTGTVIGKLNESISVQTTLHDRLNKAAEKVRNKEELSAAREELETLFSQNAQGLGKVQEEYEKNVKHNLDNLFGSAGTVQTTITGLVKQLDAGAGGIYSISGSASSDLSQIQTALDESKTLLTKASRRLATTVSQLNEAQEKGDFQTLEKIAGGEKENISSFLAAPVDLKTTELYPIENYGSSMAPFYSTLAIWVGGIVLVAMLKVTVSETSLRGLRQVKNYQTYFGRYLLFLVIGLLQSGLICLGDLYYLEIQCLHPFLFLLAGWLTSIVYVNIIYTLTVSFGDIGKAICVVLLVVQVAGSGGTFPIEVAPGFFKMVYPLLPFTHSMAAMRECIGGMYGGTYVRELGILNLFLAASLLLGLVLRKPVIRFNERFTEALESTHLM